MASRVAPTADPLHLFEVGITWPPETFLQWKLLALARRGFRVTVACSTVDDASFSLPGVEMRRIVPGPQPLWPANRSLPWLVLRAIRTALMLAVRSPRDLFALSRGLRNPMLHSPRRARTRYRQAALRTLREDLAAFSVFASIAALRPDVVHFEWEFTSVRFLTISEVCPIVISCHGGLNLYGLEPQHAPYMARLPNAFGRAAAVQCVCTELVDEAVKHGLDRSTAMVVPCGVDTSLFSPRERHTPGRELRIIAVAYLRWMKGFEFAALTMRQLLDNGVPARLDMFGGDPLPTVNEASERARIMHAIDDLGLGDHAFMHAFTPTSVLAERYREADVLLLSSVSEGVPVVILEAMAVGLPVVASDVGGIREVVRDGIDGFLVPAREPAMAALALERLWRDADLRETLGRAGRERVMSELSLDVQVERLDGLYRRAASTKASAAA